MMHYHLHDHVYITQFRDEFILLDTMKDKYTIYFKDFSEFLSGILEGGHKTLSTEEEQYIDSLMEENLLGKEATVYPFLIDKKIDSQGVANVDWRLPLESKKAVPNLQVMSALYALIKVNYYIKNKGLYESIKLIRNSRNSDIKYTIPSVPELEQLALIVNQACFLYPSRTKCLEWAMTFVLLALKRRWKCNLEIGVQNYPFMAHAWVECDEKVVFDAQEVREGLAIILNEPFRRVKQ